jgi:hypothetical protein
MSHVEIEHEPHELKDGSTLHLYHVRLYGHHNFNFVSGFLIKRFEGKEINGERGQIRGLAGKGFYALIGPHIKEIYETCAVNELFVEVSESHLRLLAFKLRRHANVDPIDKVIAHNREFERVKLTVKEGT